MVALRVLLALLLLAVPSSAQIAFDSAATANTTGTTLNVSLTVGSGSDRRIVCGIRANDGTPNAITSANYGAATGTMVAERRGDTGGDDRFVSMWQIANPATGTANVVISAGSSTFMLAVCAAYSGMGAAEANGGDDHGSMDTIDASVTTTTDNAWVVGVQGNNVGDPSAGTSTTERVSSASGAGLYDSGGVVTPPGSRTLTVTNHAAAKQVLIVAAFPPTGGGGGGGDPARGLTTLGVGR